MTALPHRPLLVLFLLGVPTVAHAQFDVLAKAISKVESVALFGIYGGFAPSSARLTTSPQGESGGQAGLHGLGVEVAIGIGESPDRRTLPDSVCAEKVAKAGGAIDTTETAVERSTVGGVETVTTTVKIAERKVRCSFPNVSYAFALGYTEVSGFRSADPALEITGALRESPTTTFYATVHPEARLSGYVGLRLGLAQLQSFRAYDSTGVTFVGSGNTFLAGIAVGAVVETVDRGLLFLELSYTRRDFPSVEWAPNGGSTSPSLPHSLNLSSWHLSAGVQIDIADD